MNEFDSMEAFANLIDTGGSIWRKEDYADVLRDTLMVDVLELVVPPPEEQPALHQALASATPPIQTIGELLQHARPPVAALNALRRCARRLSQQSDGDLPPDTATLLYFATIATAKVRLNEQISKLTPEQRDKGYRWCLEQTWSGSFFEALFQTARGS